MRFRVARHTKNLNRIIDFYGRILGLKVLGNFKDNDNYDGVFLGTPNADWLLEFTTSNTIPAHIADEDDLLVFYAKTVEEFSAIKKRFVLNRVKHVEPRNPYWAKNGITFEDPDGFRIVISIALAK